MKRGTILVIADSNGKDLDPLMLHDKKHVIIETRNTIDQAANNVPDIQYPHNVTDIVMLTSVNDIRSEEVNLEHTIQRYDALCTKYQKSFPSAKIHVGCVPPTNDRFIQYNYKLEELAARYGAPSMSTQGM